MLVVAIDTGIQNESSGVVGHLTNYMNTVLQ